MKGRKIHALVDTEGLPMRVVIHSAGMQDRDGAALVLNKIRNHFPWLQLVWADAGYHAHQVDTAVAKIPVLRLEIVSDDMKGFVVLPRRWVAAIAASPRISRTSPNPSSPSSRSLASRLQSGAWRGSCFLSRLLGIRIRAWREITASNPLDASWQTTLVTCPLQTEPRVNLALPI